MSTSNASAESAKRNSIEVKALTVDEAIARGLVRLGGLGREEVSIEVLAEGKAGLLGFGSEEALVRLTPLSEEEIKAQASGAAQDAASADSADEAPAAAESSADLSSSEEVSEPVEESPADPVLAEDMVEEMPEVVAAIASDSGADTSGDHDDSSPMSREETIVIAQEVVAELLDKLGFEGVTTEVMNTLLPVDIEGEESVVLSLSGPNLHRLSGRGGRALHALQFVARLLTSRRAGGWVNLLLDADGDRARRIKEIFMMAEQSAQLVEREGRPVSLPPMTPYERRVVHIALRQFDQVATQSIGQGKGRKVTVRLHDHLLPEL